MVLPALGLDPDEPPSPSPIASMGKIFDLKRPSESDLHVPPAKSPMALDLSKISGCQHPSMAENIDLPADPNDKAQTTSKELSEDEISMSSDEPVFSQS